ncbi:phthiocerol/phenolphthiocerol synthesis type-I polyketide synthase E [Rhodococcus sp. 27YEA15]|uniref:beta-ketoacyl synthase N-terminal-like domain-containing protein n=1 Tax=Rhodococcus sp. 27YEA15 TaxID=3156259 RepID=UPI003C7A78C4
MTGFDDEFAIVGVALALPGVGDLDQFRADLRSGAIHFETLTPEQSARSGLSAAEIGRSDYVPVASPLPDAEYFDREFFRMTPAQARTADPQQRLLISLTHDAIESSGIDVTTKRFGSYLSSSVSTYPSGSQLPRADAARLDYQALFGQDRDFLSSTVAYKFGFTGPALTIQSACSSSLVSLHQACAGLMYGDVDVAVVGAASLAFPQVQGYLYTDGGVFSPTGESRPFDSRSNGTVRGSGGCVVLVRKLADAVADGDNVLGVVVASAINNDGPNRMGYSAPSVQGQVDVLGQALSRAGISPDVVGYVEAHGTGTALGDPIEFRALSTAYADRGSRSSRCYLGSAKANYGHLDVAAGMVGLVKAMLVLDSGEVFPQPGYIEPNPSLELDSSSFQITESLVTPPGLEYAAVSSFGMGGTNSHVILRRPARRDRDTPVHVEEPVTVTLTARSTQTLARYRHRLASYLGDHGDLGLHDVVTTLRTRTRHAHVWNTRVSSVEELVASLGNDESNLYTAESEIEGSRIWLPPVPLDRVPCSSPVAAPRPPATEPSRPGVAHSVGDVFLQLVRDELGPDIEGSTDFFDAGGESITLVSLVGKLTDMTGSAVDFDRLDGASTVGEMAAALSGQFGTGDSTPSPAITFGSGRPRIHLCPPAGGTNFCYAALSRVLPRMPMSAFRASKSATVEEIAAECIETMRASGELDGRPVLGGYSFGGTVAFEIARQLEESAGAAPRAVIMIDSFAPHSFVGEREDVDRMADGVEKLWTTATAGGDGVGGVGGLDGVEAAGSGVLRSFRSLWMSNTEALAGYSPSGRIRAPIKLIRAQRPFDESWADALGMDMVKAAQWQDYTDSTVEVVEAPGDHYSLFTDPKSLDVVAAEFSRFLDEIDVDVRARQVESVGNR